MTITKEFCSESAQSSVKTVSNTKKLAAQENPNAGNQLGLITKITNLNVAGIIIMSKKFIKMPILLDDADDFYQDWMRAKKRTAESPNLALDKRYDPNMPFGDALKKMIAPPNSGGMKPTWTQKTREKYRACIQPSLEIYKLAIEKMNRTAQEKYHDQSKDYALKSLGLGALNGLFSAFLNDKEVKVRYNYKGRNLVTGGDSKAHAARGLFWATFILDTNNYINLRLTTMERDYQDFAEQTEIFFRKVNQCRKENPYDYWILKSLEEEYYDQVVFYPNYIHHPYRWLTLPVE